PAGHLFVRGLGAVRPEGRRADDVHGPQRNQRHSPEPGPGEGPAG
ncbi:Tyr recombinase domain-containing protein, partial [Dysosmobacter welbionis]